MAHGIELALEHIRGELRNARRSLKDLKQYENDYPVQVAADRKMWKALIPQLDRVVKILEEKR